jgi:hypothetical protein
VWAEAEYGLSKLPDLLHNLSQTAEMQGQIGEAIDYAERFLAAKRGGLTGDETDQARGWLLRLRDIQSGKAPRPAPAVKPAPPEAPRTATRAVAPVGWRPPAPAIGLMVGGGAALIAGIACVAAQAD